MDDYDSNIFSLIEEWGPANDSGGPLPMSQFSTVLPKEAPLPVRDIALIPPCENSNVAESKINSIDASLSPETRTPVFTLDRNLTDVVQVWQEKTIGINGRMSVNAVFKKYGDGWHSIGRDKKQSSTEKSFKSKRKIIWDAVERLSLESSFIAENEDRYDVAVNRLQKRFLEGNWVPLGADGRPKVRTLDGFVSVLKRERQRLKMLHRKKY